MQRIGQKTLNKSGLTQLVVVPQNHKISWNNEDAPYNKRWQFKWRHAYYTYPRENDSNHIQNPTKDVTQMFWTWTRDGYHI